MRINLRLIPHEADAVPKHHVSHVQAGSKTGTLRKLTTSVRSFVMVCRAGSKRRKAPWWSLLQPSVTSALSLLMSLSREQALCILVLKPSVLWLVWNSRCASSMRRSPPERNRWQYEMNAPTVIMSYTLSVKIQVWYTICQRFKQSLCRTHSLWKYRCGTQYDKGSNCHYVVHTLCENTGVVHNMSKVQTVIMSYILSVKIQVWYTICQMFKLSLCRTHSLRKYRCGTQYVKGSNSHYVVHTLCENTGVVHNVKCSNSHYVVHTLCENTGVVHNMSNVQTVIMLYTLCENTQVWYTICQMFKLSLCRTHSLWKYRCGTQYVKDSM